MSIKLSFFTIINAVSWKMLFCSNYSGTSPDGAHRHIEFYENAILVFNESQMADVCLHKFYTYIFIGHRDMVQKYKSKMAAEAILNFIKSGIYWATVILLWPISMSVPNLMKISLFVIEISPKIQIQDAAILNFAKSEILGFSNPCMANICQCTKFDENTCIFIGDPDMPKNQNSSWGPLPSWIFPEEWYWATVTLIWTTSVCLCTKCDKIIFIGNWDMAKN